MISGIYKIENKINHKVYIGQSVDIPKRWREHRSGAFNPNNKDYNMVIYQAIRKYGIENFDFVILELGLPDALNNLEVKWIKHYNSYHNGYNCTEGGDESHIHLGQPVELYDLNGKYVTEYPNITEAAKAIGVSRNTIYGIVYGNRLSTKGYQFKLKTNTNTKIGPYGNRQGGSIKINQYSLQNELIRTFPSAAAAAREIGGDSSTIIKCCKGKLKTHKSFMWRYA